MDYVELTKRLTRDVYDGASRDALLRLSRAMDRAGGLKPLIDQNDPALDPFPAEHLYRLAEVHQRYAEWKEAAVQVRRNLAKSKLSLQIGRASCRERVCHRV